MTYFLQACTAVILSAVLCLVLDRQGKEFAALICLAICSMVLVLTGSYLEPVLSFLRELEDLGNLDSTLVAILFKILGISVLTEIATLICADAGRASLGKGIHMLSTAVTLWLSIPIFQAILGLIQQILGEL